MKRILTIVVMAVSLTAFAGEVIPVGEAFLRPLQKRDSVLIGDQLQYGFELKETSDSAEYAIPQIETDSKSPIMIVKPLTMDTLRFKKGKGLSASMTITSFEEGNYELPPIPVLRRSLANGEVDTLVFTAPRLLEVKTFPIDTASFTPHPIKGQIGYKLTFMDFVPYLLGIILLGIIILIFVLLRGRKDIREDNNPSEPAHVRALRKLDHYRDPKMWEPERQKAFYSGVTYVLREYMAARYDFGAMEDTTDEIMSELKKTDVPEPLLEPLRNLLERADFVKFAKHSASAEENASVLPFAVRFVTETYQSEIDSEAEQNKKEGENVL